MHKWNSQDINNNLNNWFNQWQENSFIEDSDFVSWIKEEVANQVSSVLDDSKDVSTRIYLLRHFNYFEDENYLEYNRLLKLKDSKSSTDKEEFRINENEFKRLSKLVKIKEIDELSQEESEKYSNLMDCLDDNALIIYDSSWNNERAKKTWELLFERFWKDRWFELLWFTLPQSNKEETLSETRTKLWRSFLDMTDELRNRWYMKWGQKKNILIIWNRSYADDFLRIIDESLDTSPRISSDKMENEFYLMTDLDKEGKRITPNQPHLTITPDNYKEILDFTDRFLNEELLSLKKNDSKIWIIPLQNLLNRVLEDDKFIHDEALSWDRSKIPFDILVYYMQIAINYFRDDVIISMLEKLEASEKQFEIIFHILFSKRTNWNSTWKRLYLKLKDNNICESLQMELKRFPEIIEFDEYYDIYRTLNQKTKENISWIFDNSVDKFIKDGKNLINRKLYKLVTDEDWKPVKSYVKIDDWMFHKPVFEMDFQTNIAWNLDSWSRSNSNKNRLTIIQWNVGSWKSTIMAMLAEISQNFKDSNQISITPILLRSKDIISAYDDYRWDLSDYMMKLISAYRLSSPNTSKLLLIDWLDELPYKIREQLIDILQNVDLVYNNLIKTFLAKWHSWFENIAISYDFNILLSTRKWHLNEEGNEQFISLMFEEPSFDDIKSYISTRIDSIITIDKQQNLNKDILYGSIGKFLESWNLDEETKSTPLILFFLCELAVKWKLENISTRASLYEEFIKLILERQVDNNWICPSPRKVDNNINNLLSYALIEYKRINWIEITEKEQKEIDSLTASDYRELSLICMRLQKNNFLFIHKSFYEYLLARDFANSNKEDLLYHLRDNRDDLWGDWKEMKQIIKLYADILIDNKDYWKLHKLFSEDWLMSRDDIFWFNFFLCLEIMMTAKNADLNKEIIERIEEGLLKIIWEWDKATILNRFESFKSFQKTISFKTNPFIDKYIEVIWLENIRETQLIEIWNKACLDKAKSWFDIDKVNVYSLDYYMKLLQTENPCAIQESKEWLVKNINESKGKDNSATIDGLYSIIHLLLELEYKQWKQLSVDIIYSIVDAWRYKIMDIVCHTLIQISWWALTHLVFEISEKLLSKLDPIKDKKIITKLDKNLLEVVKNIFITIIPYIDKNQWRSISDIIENIYITRWEIDNAKAIYIELATKLETYIEFTEQWSLKNFDY